MGWQKCLAVGVMFGVAGASFASFEMLAVLDRTDRVIHRYDSETGVYLGNFGGGYIQTPIGMVLDQASNSVYVLQDKTSGDSLDYVTRLDYNTGAFLGVVSLQNANCRGFGMTNDGRFISNTSQAEVNRFSTAGSTNGFVSNFSFGVTTGNDGMDVDDSGRLWAMNRNGVIYGWEDPFSVTGATPTYSLGAPTPSNFRGQLTTRGDLLLAVNRTSFTFATLAPTGGLLAPSNLGFSLTYSGAAIGHNGMMYVSGYSGTSLGSVQRWDRFGNFNGSFGSDQLNDPMAMGVVIAPEPGTMLALGVGAAALLRRRRNAK